jgi:hypothetical protein
MKKLGIGISDFKELNNKEIIYMWIKRGIYIN